MTAVPVRTLRVMEVLDPPDGTTRYVDQLVQDLPPDIALSWFTWWRALTSTYDVLHVHWPERLTRSKERWKQPLNRVAFCLLMVRLRLTRTAIVRTEHNVGPHEAGDRVEDALLTWLDRRTTLSIQLNPTTAVDPRRLHALIRLGHYRDRFASLEHRSSVPGRVVYFGLIRPYKGVDRLLECVAELRDPQLSLRVVGRPQTPYWQNLVTAACEADARISARLEFVDDASLVREVTAAALVALPFRELHNSSTLLVALSLDRAVLVPRTPSTVALAAEVGSGWVHLFDGDLTAAVLAAALASASAHPPEQPPNLADRQWSLVGARHADSYRRAVAAVKTTHSWPPGARPGR